MNPNSTNIYYEGLLGHYENRSNELENIVSKINDASANIFIEDNDLNLINKKAIKRLKTIDFDADDKVPPGIIS